MRKIGSAGLALLLLLTLLPVSNNASANGTLGIIEPLAAGQATGGGFFPLGDAFDSTDVAWDAVSGVPTGSPGGGAPYYAGRAGYVDFGPDWANVRIESTWTKYYAYTTGNQTPYAELWWDDDTDTVNDSGLTETDINFNSAQGLNTGSAAPWVRDSNLAGNPLVPEGRYLMLRSPSTMTNRATEYAFVGWLNLPVTAITVTGAGGASTISTSGGTLQMSAAITPSNAGLQTVTWTSTNGTGSATISAGGLLTAVSNGTVTVRATAQDGSGVFGTKTITISNQGLGGNEPLQIITPVQAGSATGMYFPMQDSFDNQPTLDVNTGYPVGTATGNGAPYYASRAGYIDFGTDWSKVKILATWTQYRSSSSGNQTPYSELWWDDDIDTTNDSGLTETRFNFNSAQGINTGSTTPWIRDNEISGTAVSPLSRYLLLRAPATMTTRALEYAFIGWIDANGNGVQNAPYTPVSQINVTGAGGATTLLIGNTLQMSASVLPYTASNKTIVWSVMNGTGSATISSGGLLTPVTDGTVTVRATAQDGSGVVGTRVIDISQYESFILTRSLDVNGRPHIYSNDIQADYPGVNWQTVKRLYIPAGHYDYIRLNNLPQRAANNPLIITNYGGKVEISSNFQYTFFIGGGSNWKLTGEYNNTLKTGHASYTGHANGNYANSKGNYGIEVGRSSNSSIMVSNRATNFELSFLEIHHSGFAGLLVKTDGDATATMDGVKIHDNYIHDIEAEGMYFGNTSGTANQHMFTNLKIYNNRVIRTGTEGIQLSQQGNGLEVYNNVVALCAMDWKDPFAQWQDGCFQYAQRVGSGEVYNNVFIGGAGDTFEMVLSKDAADTNPPGSQAWVHDNYFSHGRDFFGYVHNAPSNPTATLRFEDNIMRQFNFQYGELPGKTDLNKLIFAVDNVTNPLYFTNNLQDGTKTFIDTVGGNNGTSGNVTATGNVTAATVAPIVFEDVTFPTNFDWTKIERWDDYSNLYSVPIYYNQGDYAYYFPTGELYLCIEAGSHTAKNPTTNPSTWQLVPMMTDDFRTDATSPYQGMGLLD
ncbi:Ig-like domain-containing protein [Cohnella lupini]|uniref:Uncharacterized protein YjdB n=1 Tax=Cohnella lupini TaxID=1294267 RepID=A0A3D9HNV2_9BACL|nr:Ig-like domain-containing protein [Cohnella lupini]RED51157.1 uncharacterized protein YjdB [Cohnella lupini]